MEEYYLVFLVILLALVITIGYVFYLFRAVKKIKVENQKADEISGYIREGARAFLKREYRVIIPFVVIVALILTALGFIPALSGAEGVGWQSAICFVVGASLSALNGYVGMRGALIANVRTTDQAEKKGLSHALRVAFSGGSILGLAVVGFGLLGLVSLFFIFLKIFNLDEAVHVVQGYALGCSMIALFARVGGGIYTKAADVGADLVGKIEAGIPEDDHRNPATIADNVGDNVGDIAGMGSDLTESYIGSIVSALALGIIQATSVAFEEKNVLFVFIIAAIGAVSSLLSAIFIRSKTWKNPQRTLSLSTYIAGLITIIGTFFVSFFFLDSIRPFLSVVIGLVTGIILGKIAEYYTSADFKAVKEIAKESESGHATNVIAGLGSGMQSTALTVIVLAIGIVLAYVSDKNFGIALAAVGMLTTVGSTVSVDGYGPIADNAGGIAEMSGCPKNVRKITDRLDAVGNTTAAIGKGFCIGSAAFTALALFMSYAKYANLESINIISVEVISGLLIGAMLPFLFSSLVIKSVGKAANKMVMEVRRQFKEDPGILQGTSTPNYAACVDIATKAALKEMVFPGIIAICSPIVMGLIFGAEGLGGLLVGGLASAIMLAVFMANSGGAWDNAKKYIEEGNMEDETGEIHKATITGDTVGDPLKDTAGPSMDILIKLMSVIALIIAPILASDGFKSLWDIISELF
ncbi:MAG: sodium-translocating pyrophosphatase [Bacillales bacterium]|nr:sodium-translocating pyrophosphatase [Bacillales bacterium]